MSKSEKAFHRFIHEAMTTTFEALIVHERQEYARQAAVAVFAEIDRIEGLLSKYDARAEVAQINRLQPGQWMRVGAEVVECLGIASIAYLETGGAFDPTYAARRHCPEKSAMEWLVLSAPESRDRNGYWAGIAAEAAQAGFYGACLDLGGIGKGFALDKAMGVLREWEIGNALLNSGTSTVLAAGSMTAIGDGWTVGVGADWGKAAGLDRIQLRDMALSGSGKTVKGDHIRDPFKPAHAATNHVAAWARCSSAAMSDAITTAFMIMSSEEVNSYCMAHTNVAGMTVEQVARGEAAPHFFGEWATLASA